MDRELILRLVTAQEMFLDDFARCGSSFGSKEADASWVKLSLAINEIVSASEVFTESGGSFRQDLVKAIAPLVVQKVLENNKNIDFFEFEEYVAKRTNKLVNLLIEGGTGE